jgi:hypothetical protein
VSRHRTDQAKRTTRVAVDIDAALTTSDGHTFKVLVRDLSAQGFRLELDEEVLVGEQVSLQVGSKGVFAAEIIWALGREAGGQFLEAVSGSDIAC